MRVRGAQKGSEMGKSSGGDMMAMQKPMKTTQTMTRAAASGAAPAPAVQAPTTEVVTPAVARDIGVDVQTAQQNQALARSRLAGIRSTWSSLGGGTSKLGS